jgi:hypothetical protein
MKWEYQRTSEAGASVYHKENKILMIYSSGLKKLYLGDEWMLPILSVLIGARNAQGRLKYYKRKIRPRCCNCIFAGQAFKVVGKTHYHCGDEKQYPPEKMQNGDISPWDTLRGFSDSCNSHEFKQCLLTLGL